MKQIVAATIAGLEYSYRPQVFAIIEAAVFYSDPIEITPGRIKTDRIYQSRLFGWFLSALGVLAVGSCGPAAPPAAPPAPLVLEEATIAGIHAAFASGTLTCRQLVTAYLARIEAYDDDGPALNAVLTVNPSALEIAADMDARHASSPSAVGPLHCVPVVLKDNYDTADLPTTGGSVTLAESIPRDDAFVVQRLREAGALVLAKANLTELARGGTTLSSLGGQTKNPYDLTRTPGGSSGGTGAAIAANFAAIGTGSDTGQSIRSPASAGSLVGLRPTRGLVSRDGIIPLSTTQDAAGPITRTVEDAARMLDAIAGHDPNDPITAFSLDTIPDSYTHSLNRDGLAGARMGVLVDFLAISEFPKWRKYLILLSFLDNSSARPVQIGGVDVNICHSRSTAVRGRRRSSSQSPPRGPFCRTRTGPVEADGAVDAQNAPTAPWKTLCVFHELPQGLSHQVTHEKLRKAPKYRWETRIDPISLAPTPCTRKSTPLRKPPSGRCRRSGPRWSG